MEHHEERARALFLSGCNCAQSVFGAFAADMGMEEKTALSIASSFGGGIGRLRLLCGGVSGALMALGYFYGGYDPLDNEEKKKHYERTRLLVGAFEKEAGALLCKDLLKENQVEATKGFQPEQRTKEYYEKRKSCLELVALGARLVDTFLENNGTLPPQNPETKA